MTERAPSSYEVPEELAGERADKIVAALGEMSRSMARELVDAGEVTGAAGPLEAKARLDAGAVISFPAPML